MSFHQNPSASHRRRRSLRFRLKLLVALVIAGAGLFDIANHITGATTAQTFAGVIPSVTLSNASGQAANRLAIDTSALRDGADLVVPVSVTNAGNQALKGVMASLVSANPGIGLTVDSVPVGPDSTVQYRLRLTQTASGIARPDRVIVAFTPAP